MGKSLYRRKPGVGDDTTTEDATNAFHDRIERDAAFQDAMRRAHPSMEFTVTNPGTDNPRPIRGSSYIPSGSALSNV